MANSFLYLENATLKHINGDTYPPTTEIMSENIYALPMAIVVPDNDYDTIFNIFNAGDSTIIDNNGNKTSKFYSIENQIPEFFTIPIYGVWGDYSNYYDKINAYFSCHALTNFVSGAYNNAVVIKDDYEMYCNVPSMSHLSGAYKNGVIVYAGWDRFASIMGYGDRAVVHIYNESLTRSFGATIDPTPTGQVIRSSIISASIATPVSIKAMLVDIAKIGDLPEEPTDPYRNAGDSDVGGGSGAFDYTGDTIAEPNLPTIGAAATGFVSLFNPTASQLQTLMDYLWSNLFDLDTIKRLYADPMQQFIGLSLVPVPVPSSGAKTIQVGGVSTGVTLNAASAQFVSIDCGSVTFNSSSLTASYLDFLPYTKTQLYLPYIGIVDVSTDDIMDKTVNVKYHVDILTGGCIAYIIVGGSVLYQYSGQCAINIPLSSIDWSTTISSALNLVSSAIGGIISGASVPLTGGMGALLGAQGIANMGASAANAAINAKPTINKSGAIGGSSGIMAVQTPYLIVTCPNLAHASNQDHYTGYPSFITKSIAECNGYCSFEKVYLSGLGLTDEEMLELENILSEGVYL